MNVLITGGHGFVASYLEAELYRLGIRYFAPSKEFLNVTYPDHFGRLRGKSFGAVVHLGALLMIDGHSPEEYFAVNALGTYNVLEFCRQRGIRNLIYSMTHSDTNKAGNVFIEDDEPQWFGTGGWEKNAIPFISSKIAAADMIEAYNRMGVLDGKILRLSNIRGVGSADTKYGCVFHNFIQKAKRGEDIEIWGNPPKTIRDMIYVKDVVRAIVLALTNPCLKGIFNIGSGKGYTIVDEAEAIIDVFCPTVKKSQLIYRPDIEEYRKKSCVFVCKRAKEELGWSPVYSYREGLEDMKDIMEKGSV